MLDVLIHNAQVVDGSGSPRFRADIATKGDRIVTVGLMPHAQARTVIDASDCVVTPGFVDMHSHCDFTLPILPTADSLIHQGITTAVVGQCGSTLVPLLDESREQVIAAMRSQDLALPWERWSTFGSYLDYLTEISISINVVSLVGQGMVRKGVMGFSAGPADQEQMVRMQSEVIKAMESGAIGVSTGLIYPPGSCASTKELISLTRPVGERGGFYFSHIRDEGETLLEAVGEAIHIGRETGAAVHISHFKASGRDNWHKSAPALALIDQARAEGLDVTADMYPYLASSTGLDATLPQWALEGGKQGLAMRLSDDETRAKMTTDMQSGGYSGDEWDNVLISCCPKHHTYEGHSVANLAEEIGKSPHDWVFDLLLETDMDVTMVKFGMSEENRVQELRHPAMMIGSDGYALATEGPLSEGLPHPRSYGAFPRVLGHYTRERGALSLEEAVRKMTGLPAEKLRWSDRGLVKRGYVADLVVLEPDIVKDLATYESPHQYPQGIRHVIVAGEPVIQDGVHTKARPGKTLGR
jgi:N-acyl-D-amino-acid deacylase